MANKKEKPVVRYKKVIVHNNDSHSTDTGVKFIAGKGVYEVRFEKETELPEVALSALSLAIPIITTQKPKTKIFIKTPRPKYRIEELSDWYTKEEPKEKPEEAKEKVTA